MNKPSAQRTYPRNDYRPYDVEFHLLGCSCEHCTETPPLPIAKLTIAGIIVGNAIAFAWDAHGALAALAATIGVQL